MPISKNSILAIAKPDLTSVSSDAVDLINGILEKFLDILLPEDGGVFPAQIRARCEKVIEKFGERTIFGRIAGDDDLHNVMEGYNPAIPKDTVKRIIREHVGNINVSVESIDYVGNIIATFVDSEIIKSVRNCEDDKLQKELDKKPNTLTGKHILMYLFETEEGKKNEIHLPPIGPLTKGGQKSKKRSSSKRRSSSKKRCSPRQIAVKSFIRDGKRIKSYCRKK